VWIGIAGAVGGQVLAVFGWVRGIVGGGGYGRVMTSGGSREWDATTTADGGSVAQLAAGIRERLERVPAPRREIACSYRDDLIELRALADRVDDLYLERLAVFESSGEYAADGAVSTAAWLRRHLGTSPVRAKSDVTAAKALHNSGDHSAPATATALREGKLTMESARVVVRALATMPVDRVAEAETALLDAAARLDSAGLAIVASRLRHLLRPEDALARHEYARSQRELTLTTTFEGMWWLQGLLTPEDSVTLKGVLDSMSAPGSSTTATTSATATDAAMSTGSDTSAKLNCGVNDPAESRGDDRTPAQRRADALGELARWAACAGAPPIQGGIRPHLVVRVDVDDLIRRTGVASVGWADSAGRGSAVPGWLARMTACDTNLSWIGTTDVPASRGHGPDMDSRQPSAGEVGELDLAGLVRKALAELAPALGGIPREVLAAGRSTRLVTPGQRAALNARDRGCVLPGCDRPPEWCEAHHLIEWIDGGPTDLDNLVLVCRRHHTMLHERGQHLVRERTGGFRIHPTTQHTPDTPDRPPPRAPDTG